MGKYGKKNHVKIDPLAYNTLLLGESKVGKEQPISEPILTEDGWIPMGDVNIGMKVYGEDGKLHDITGIYPQGVKKVYKITFSDGTSTRCGLEHLWMVKDRYDKSNNYKVIELKEIMKDYKKYTTNPEYKGGGCFSYRYSIPVANAIDFYNNSKPSIMPDNFIDTKNKCNVTDILTRMSNTKDNKNNRIKLFIPDKYKYSSISDRSMLLSAFINSIGKVSNDKKRINMIFKSQRLFDDLKDISRSLGYITITKENRNEYFMSISSSDYSKLTLSDDIKNELIGNDVEYIKSIVNIEYVSEEESQCIMVDNPNHLYITKDFIVTHNTTLIKEVCEKLAGEDGYMFLEIGQERGADAIEGIHYVNCPEWNMDYDDGENSAGFQDVIDDIIANKSTDYKNLKVVVWDTYDQLITIAEHESIRLWNKECRERNAPEKCTKSINAAWGGFQKGEKKAIELMFDAMADLRKVGVSTIIIGHVKNKDVSDAVTGETYQILTSDQAQTYFNALKKNLHFLGLAYIDRTIVKENTGKKNIVTGKDIKVNKVHNETRKIKFRDDNYAVDSGSRFADIVPEINMDSDEFIKALEDAIEAERKKSGKTFEETKAEQDALEHAKEERVAKEEKEKKLNDELNELKGEITSFFVDNKSDLNKIKPVLAKCKELGYANPNEISNIDDAKTILATTLTV